MLAYKLFDQDLKDLPPDHFVYNALFKPSETVPAARRRQRDAHVHDPLADRHLQTLGRQGRIERSRRVRARRQPVRLLDRHAGPAQPARHALRRRPPRQADLNLGWKLAQVVNRTSPESLLDTYHAERHPVGARVLRNTMAAAALLRPDERIAAVREIVAELLGMDEPRARFAAMMAGLDVHYDLGEGHPLLGRRMPDLAVLTGDGPTRVFTLLHEARPVLLNLGEPGSFDLPPWADRVQLVDAEYGGAWELPALGAVTAPAAVLVRPDGHVAWVGDGTRVGAHRGVEHLVRLAGGRRVEQRVDPKRAGRPEGGPHAGELVKLAALPARPSSQTGHRGADGQARCRLGMGERQACARGRTVPGRRLR